jgi:hypothetical protein
MVSVSAKTLTFLTEVLYGFPQSFQEDAREVPQIFTFISDSDKIFAGLLGLLRR